MAKSQRNVTLEIPEEIVKLTPQQKAQLRKTFRTTIANELSTIAEKTVSDIMIENIKPKPKPKKGVTDTRKAVAKKGTKKK